MGVGAEKAMPEQGKRDARRADTLVLQLIMKIIEALAAKIEQMIGVGVRRGLTARRAQRGRRRVSG